METTEREVSYLEEVKKIRSEECKSADVFSNVKQDGVLVSVFY